MSWESDIANPDFTFGSWFPKSNDPGFTDAQAYLDWLKQQHDSADWNQQQFEPTRQFTSADGQTMSAAGNDSGITKGDYAAQELERKFMATRDPSGNTVNQLGFENYLHMHPDEARAAVNAFDIDPQTGLPKQIMDDSLYALISRELGIVPDKMSGPGAPGGMPGTQTPPPSDDPSRYGLDLSGTKPSDAYNPFIPGVNIPEPAGPSLTPIESGVGGGAQPKPINTEAVVNPGDTRVADQFQGYQAALPPDLSHLPAIVARYFQRTRQLTPPVYGYQRGQ